MTVSTNETVCTIQNLTSDTNYVFIIYSIVEVALEEGWYKSVNIIYYEKTKANSSPNSGI